MADMSHDRDYRRQHDAADRAARVETPYVYTPAFLRSAAVMSFEPIESSLGGRDLLDIREVSQDAIR